MGFDLQVNGFAGADFNSDDLDAAGLHRACMAARDHGADHFLATIITDSTAAMERRLRRLVALRGADPLASSVIAGLHVEGPFLNETPGFIGAHPASHATLADVEKTKRLLDAGDGLVRLVTLAPERDPNLAVTRFLAGQSITVSAGHCDPTLDQLRAAIDAGLTMFTHVGNGCPAHLPRHDNIVQRALHCADRLWLCFIADGVHVPPFALANYLKTAGLDRSIVVTDAMSAASLGPGRYRLGRWSVDIGEDLAAWAPDRSHLVGSAATMNHVRNILRQLGLDACAIDQLTEVHPRQAIGLSDA